MLSPPRVTIAMPVYNGGEFFEQALESALGQTYSNVEIIAVNDGSTDGGHTDLVAGRYAKHIRYIRKENGGVSSALNTVIANMTGDVFTWLSHDDLFEVDKTEAQVDYWLSLGKSDSCLISDFCLIDDAGVITQQVSLDRSALVQAPMLPLYRGMISGCTVFIPKLVLDDVGLFDLSLRHVQDYDLWRRIVSKYEFFHVPQMLVRSRQHAGQDSRKHDAVLETEALWHGMVTDLSELQRAGMYGSSYRFWAETSELLSWSPNKKTSAYCATRAEEALSDTPVSVVVRVETSSGDAGLARTLSGLAAQTYAPTEILVLWPYESVPDIGLAHGRAVFVDPRSSEAAQWNVGLRATSGAYVAMLEAGDILDHGSVQDQVQDLLRSGFQASAVVPVSEGRSSLSQYQPDGGRSSPRGWTVHRSLIAGGQVFEDRPDGIAQARESLKDRGWFRQLVAD